MDHAPRMLVGNSPVKGSSRPWARDREENARNFVVATGVGLDQAVFDPAGPWVGTDSAGASEIRPEALVSDSGEADVMGAAAAMLVVVVDELLLLVVVELVELPAGW